MARRLPWLLVTCTLLAAASPASAQIDFNLTAGIDLAGTIDSGVDTADSDPGYSLGLELVIDVPIVELGLGFEYGFPRGADLDDLEIKYSHLYGFARLYLIGPIYLVARYGYYDVSFDELAAGDISSGGTFGGGAGVSLLGKLKVEVLASGISGPAGYESWSARLVYTF